MERRSLIAVLGGLALLVGAVVVLRTESPPPLVKSNDPVTLTRFLDERVDYRAEKQGLVAPSDLKLTALDITSLRAMWTPTAGYGYEVRWADQVRLVVVPETELTGLPANDEVTVEVRAVDAEGHRSAPSSMKAVPRLLYNEAWADHLVAPVDHFDGQAALSSHRWRVLGDDDCLGLRSLPGVKRVEITCDNTELQSNMTLVLTEPQAAYDGERGRVMLTMDGPGMNANGLNQEASITLLPEPYDDLPWLGMYDNMSAPTRIPPSAIVMHITPFGASFDKGVDVPTTSRVVPVSGRSVVASTGVRHRWELRVLQDAVVAVRDGEVLAAMPAAVPWTTARARLAFRDARGTTIDSFGVGGGAENPRSTSVIPLGPSEREPSATTLGTVSSAQFAGAESLRVVAGVYGNNDAPVTVRFGDREVLAKPMFPWGAVGPTVSTTLYADFPLPDPAIGDSSKLRLTSTTDIDSVSANVVVRDGVDAPARKLPRVSDLGALVRRVAQPRLSVGHESNVSPPTQFPRGGKVRLVVELDAGHDHVVAETSGIEVELDGDRIVTLPTTADGPSAGGRYEFWLEAGGLTSGAHRITARVQPKDPSTPPRDTQQSFEIRAG
ncbi:fibronectin type III domain-containing protein [Umezawaea endophytica]|uniref:Fibronectin type III domain-containing protein n=1 Tax=Umezawaea endophytica TaxID=1654476 RepID=A0A9X2VW25_9PSEU|nr:fibronectin type III domain-containing protein [Umezawaea endophytica]MCS7483447.1 fibronectin type III domain-containing protein [Umezawaea endophytica]